MTRNRAICELVLAGAFWGFGFVATVWGLQTMSPVHFLFLRFFLSFLFAVIAIIAMHFQVLNLQKQLFSQSVRTLLSQLYSEFTLELRLGFPAGLLLGSLLLLQTIGLKTTTATESGFITTLYVIFVPMFQHFFFQKKQPFAVFAYAALALIGVAILAGGLELTTFSTGHGLTLICAIIAAFHIIYVGFVGPKSKNPFQFNAVQSIICSLMMASMLPFERTSLFEIKNEILPGVAFS